MLIKSKWGAVVLIVLGIIIALGNGYSFLSEHTAMRGVAFLVGIGFIWMGVSNLRDLRSGDLP